MSPFSRIYPLARFLALWIVAALMAPGVAAQDNLTIVSQTQKNACMAAFDHREDAVRSILLMQAKRAAIEELFGETIRSFTRLKNLVLESDEIEGRSAGYVRVKGDPRYYAGSDLGEICVEIDAFVTAADFVKFQPQRVGKKTCVAEGDVKEIARAAEDKARAEALLEYDNRLGSLRRQDIFPLMREITYTEGGFVSGTSVYCVRATGVIYPFEVLALVEPYDSPDLAEPMPDPTPESASARRSESRATRATPSRERQKIVVILKQSATQLAEIASEGRGWSSSSSNEKRKENLFADFNTLITKTKRHLAGEEFPDSLLKAEPIGPPGGEAGRIHCLLVGLIEYFENRNAAASIKLSTEHLNGRANDGSGWSSSSSNQLRASAIVDEYNYLLHLAHSNISGNSLLDSLQQASPQGSPDTIAKRIVLLTNELAMALSDL